MQHPIRPMLWTFVQIGCGFDDYSTAVKANKKKKSEDMFEKIDSGYLYTRIVYDKQTGVEYAMSWGYCNEGTLTLLVNADGTPKVYEGWKK